MPLIKTNKNFNNSVMLLVKQEFYNVYNDLLNINIRLMGPCFYLCCLYIFLSVVLGCIWVTISQSSNDLSIVLVHA